MTSPPSSSRAQNPSLDHALSPYLLERARDGVKFRELVDWTQLSQEGTDRLRMIHLGPLSPAARHWASRCFGAPAVQERLARSFDCWVVDAEEDQELTRWARSCAAQFRVADELSLHIFTLPDGRPCFACGALPPTETDAEGSAHFAGLLDRLVQLNTREPAELEAQAARLVEALGALHPSNRAEAPLEPSSRVSASWGERAVRRLQQGFDQAFGGWGEGPKHLNHAALTLLLDQGDAKNDAPLNQATLTLDAALSGALRDQLSGGWFVATQDRKWAQPVMMQRLEHNALTLDILLTAFQATGHDNYRQAAAQTVEFLLGTLQSPEGGFFHELLLENPDTVAHYAWTRARVVRCVGDPAATHFCQFYEIREEDEAAGFFPVARRTIPQVAAELGIDPATLIDSVREASAKLLAARGAAPPPTLDDRQLAHENFLAATVLFRAALLLGDGRASAAALRTLTRWTATEPPRHRAARGERFSGPASALDRAAWFQAVVTAHEATGDPSFLQAAQTWALSQNAAADREQMRSRVASGATYRDDRALAATIDGLRRLAVIGSDPQSWDLAVSFAERCAPLLRRAPTTFLAVTSAALQLLQPTLRLEIAGDLGQEQLEAIRAQVVTQLPPASCLATTPGAEVPFSLAVAIDSPDRVDAVLSQARSEQHARRRQDLTRTPLRGRASTEGTTRRLERSKVRPEARATLGTWHVSRLGLGSYRIGLDKPEHRRAVVDALRAGCNLIDSSPAFAWGDAERLLGEVLAELHENDELQRDEIVVMTKVGVFWGDDARQLADTRRTVPSDVFPLAGKSADTLVDGAFCLDPDRIEEQLASSRERWGLDHFDVCWIQSPEHWLQSGGDRAALVSALASALRRLDELADRGWLSTLGVMSNTLVPRGAGHTQLSLADLVEAARQAGTERLRFLMLPVNLGQLEALTPRRTSSPKPGSDANQSLADAAEALGWELVACRPLSVAAEHGLLRLVDPPATTDSGRVEPLSRARYRVASLEAEFETTFAVQLRLAGRAGKGAVLPLSGALGQAFESVQTLAQFDQVETTMLSPQLGQLLGQLDRAFAQNGAWAAFKKRYVQAVGGYLASVREQVRQRQIDDLESLGESLRDQPVLAPWFADEAEVARLEAMPWARRALALQVRLPALRASVVGLRRPTHVDDVREILSGNVLPWPHD